MSSCVGCDLGADTTVWSRASRGRGVVSIDAGGSMQSAVGVDGDGQLQVVGVDPAGPALSHETAGFVDALGGSEPIMVGTTPYGPEALVSTVFSAVLAASADMPDVLPDAFAIVHDDDLDPFRASLLTEAARLAGIPTERVRLVTRSEARAAAIERDGDDPSGAALAALAAIPDADGPGGGGAALAGAAGLAAGGAVGLGVHLADGGTAAAAAPAAGPAGVPLAGAGPSGATAGPGGTPLGSAGPGGTPLGSAGPGGTPLASGGPTGTPLGSAGPGGTPLDTSGTPSAGGAAPKPRPRWLAAAAVGGAVAIVAVVGVVVLAQDDDDPPQGAAVTTTAAAEPVAAGATEEPAVDPAAPVTEPASPTTDAGATEFDTSAFIGEWQNPCEPFLAGDGASTGRYSFEPAGPNQLELTISGVDFLNVDCAGEGETIVTYTATLTILGETVVEGRDAYFGESDIGAFVIAVDGDTLYRGEGSTFDPAVTATRR